MPVPDVFAGAADCARCRRQSFRFERVWAMGFYRDLLREAVVCMKRQSHEPLVCAVGQLMAETMDHRIRDAAPDFVVPLPMHWSRRWSRGMNVAELLAAAVRRKSGIPCLRKMLSCRRKLKKQGTLGPGQRITNVRGAFRVSASYDIKNAHILLVDDVMTTGATANEAAIVLRRAGAARVDVVVAARAVGTD